MREAGCTAGLKSRADEPSNSDEPSVVRPPAVHPLPFPYLEGQSINILMGRNCRAFTLYCGGRSRCRRIKSPPFFRGLFSLNALACLSSSLLDPYILFLPSFIFLSRPSSLTHALGAFFVNGCAPLGEKGRKTMYLECAA